MYCKSQSIHKVYTKYTQSIHVLGQKEPKYGGVAQTKHTKWHLSTFVYVKLLLYFLLAGASSTLMNYCP